MHSKLIRSYEAADPQKRRVWHVTRQGAGGNASDGNFKAGLPAAQVVAGWLLHETMGASVNGRRQPGLANVGFAGGLAASVPPLDQRLAITAGNAIFATAWADGIMNKTTVSRLNFDLNNGAGALQLTQVNNTNDPTALTVTFRDRRPHERTAPINPRIIPRPPSRADLPGPDWSSRFFYGPTGRPAPQRPTPGSRPPAVPPRDVTYTLTSGGGGRLPSNVVRVLRS